MNKARFVWLVLCLIWGSTWIFIKLGLRDLPPLTFAGLRFLLAASILWILIFVQKRKLPTTGRDWWLLAWTGGLAFSLNYALIFWGEQYIASGLAAVLQAMIPAFGMLFAHFYLPNERLTGRKIAGVMTGILGVGLIFFDQMKLEGTMALWGSAGLLVSAVDVGFYNVVIKARAGHLDPAVLAAGQMTFGILPLLGYGFLFEGNPFLLRWTVASVGSLLYLSAVGSSIAFLLYYWLVHKIEVTKTMLISLVTPVIALLIGLVTIGEQVSWRVAVGSVAIISGISLIVVQRAAPFTRKEVKQ